MIKTVLLKIIYPVIIILFLSFISCVKHSTLIHIKNQDDYSNAEFEVLEAGAKRLDRTLNIYARNEYIIYFNYGRGLVQRNRLQEAIKAFRKGLRLYAWDMNVQVLLAELEIEQGEIAAAYDRLLYVRDNSDDPLLVDHSQHLIQKNKLDDRVQKLPLQDMSDFRLIIVPIGQVHQLFLDAVTSRLTQEFRITVEIVDISILPDEIGKREKYAPFLDNVLEQLKNYYTKKELESLYSQLELSHSGPVTLDEKELFVRTLVMNEEDGKEKWAQILWQNQDQYDVRALHKQVTDYTESIRSDPKVIGVLGISGVDLYTETLNYLFAWGVHGIDIMSYSRFYGPHDSVSIGLHRTIVQAMTSMVRILGIKRASTLPCATAYPHSLGEFDQKIDVLCSVTVNRLRARYSELRNGE